MKQKLLSSALELRMPMAEMDTAYKERPEGSTGKLHTYRDGIRICWDMFHLLKEERPFQLLGTFFLAFSLLSMAVSVGICYYLFECRPRSATPDRDVCRCLELCYWLS